MDEIEAAMKSITQLGIPTHLSEPWAEVQSHVDNFDYFEAATSVDKIKVQKSENAT